jgi:ATP-dependent protease ClpP protease subunit
MAKVTLKVYGDIGEPAPDFFMFEPAETFSAKQVSEFLDANAAADEIVVRINSRGGDVQEGWAIYDLLTTSGKKITTIGEGKVYSIATVIFLAGSERQMLKNADGLIHMPFIPPYTLADAYESTDLLKIAESLAQEEEKILNLYVERTGADREKLATYMKDETKLSAEDMLALGFATKIVEPVKAYAVYKPKNHSSKMTQPTEAQKQSLRDRFEALMNGDFAKAFSRLADETKAQEMTDAKGNKFTLQKESGMPAVGDAASPDGTYTMENGDTIVIANGKVESVTPKAAPDDELSKAQAEIQRLKDELAAATAKANTAETAQNELKTKVTALETAASEAKAKETEVVNLIKDLRKLQNEWKPAGRAAGTGGTNSVDGIDLNRVREVQAKINNQKTDE